MIHVDMEKALTDLTHPHHASPRELSKAQRKMAAFERWNKDLGHPGRQMWGAKNYCRDTRPPSAWEPIPHYLVRRPGYFYSFNPTTMQYRIEKVIPSKPEPIR